VINGLGRHRLSVAISTDEGMTWGNFKNLYSLDDYNYVQAKPPQPTIPAAYWIKYGQGQIQWEFDAGIGKVGDRGQVGAENVYVLPLDTQRYHRRNPASLRTCYPRIFVTDEVVMVSYQMGKPGPITEALDIFPIDWLYDPIVPSGPYGRLVLNAKPVPGADLTIEDGTEFGWADAMGAAVGVEAERIRVPVRRFLQNHGATIPPDGWHPEQGLGGTLYVTRAIATAPAPVSETAAPGLAEIPGSIKVIASGGLPVNLVGVPIGTTSTVTFDLPVDPGGFNGAWLELDAEDVDEPREAKITLNDKVVIEATDDILHPQFSVRGRLAVPLSALVMERNTLEFTFADNLGGTTQGYEIHYAALVLARE